MSGKNRVFSWEFKEGVAQRMLNGESVSALHHELQIKRSVLYRWRDAYRKEGVAGLQRPGAGRRESRIRRGQSAPAGRRRPLAASRSWNARSVSKRWIWIFFAEPSSE